MVSELSEYDFPPDDESLQRLHYDRYVLADIDRSNLIDIEATLARHCYTRKGLNDSLNYLENLQHQLQDIRRFENQYASNQSYMTERMLKLIAILINRLHRYEGEENQMSSGKR